MTRCNYRSFKNNLKSTVYNPAGQGYDEQLTAYNAMSNHLRKILSAKSVVDARNLDYISNKCIKNKMQSLSDKQKPITKCQLQNIIDRLAYDTKHHPHDVVRMNWELGNCHSRCDNDVANDGRYVSNSNEDLCPLNCGCSSRGAYGASYSRRDTDRSHRRCVACYDTAIPSLSGQKASANLSPNRLVKDKHRTCFVDSMNNVESDIGKYLENPRVLQCPASHPDMLCPRTIEGISHLDAMKVDPNENWTKSYNDVECPLNRSNENAKYVKFAFDITEEIMKRGYYTDKQMNEVFDRHIGKNLGKLDKRRMIQEINSLKRALNMTENTSGNEMDYNTGRFSSITDPKPPTPPKTLDDNKLIEKLRSFQTQPIILASRSANSNHKKLLLVEPNSEILVTEEDILSTLVEMNLDSRKAEMIYRSLQNKSKDLIVEQERPTKRTDDESSEASLDSNEDINYTTSSFARNQKASSIRSSLYKQNDENLKVESNYRPDTDNSSENSEQLEADNETSNSSSSFDGVNDGIISKPSESDDPRLQNPIETMDTTEETRAKSQLTRELRTNGKIGTPSRKQNRKATKISSQVKQRPADTILDKRESQSASDVTEVYAETIIAPDSSTLESRNPHDVPPVENNDEDGVDELRPDDTT